MRPIKTTSERMKPDIATRQDIEHLIQAFYAKVKADSLISHFFRDVVPVDWEKHLPVMYDFWENVVFHTGHYDGNPMAKHLALHQKSPLQMDDFSQWLTLFTETVDEHFEGEKATLIKQRATSIATVMQIKLFH